MQKPEDYPLITGLQRLTKNWALTLPAEFRRRVENEHLVIWRPGLTFWIDAFGNESGETIEERIADARASLSPHAKNITEARTANVAALRYQLAELGEGGVVQNALFTLMHGADGRIMMAAYHDSAEALDMAMKVSASLTYTGAPSVEH